MFTGGKRKWQKRKCYSVPQCPAWRQPWSCFTKGLRKLHLKILFLNESWGKGRGKSIWVLLPKEWESATAISYKDRSHFLAKPYEATKQKLEFCLLTAAQFGVVQKTPKVLSLMLTSRTSMISTLLLTTANNIQNTTKLIITSLPNTNCGNDTAH